MSGSISNNSSSGAPKSPSSLTTPRTNNYGISSIVVANNSNSEKQEDQMKSTMTKKDGELKVVILSAYDLLTREPPSYVSVEVCSQIVTTGPPVQRHKDRNSFKFGGTNAVSIRAPLPDLYKSIVKVRLVYANHMEYNHVADYPLQQLHINEPMWLIFRLEKDSTMITTVTSTSNGSCGSFDNNDVMSTKSGFSKDWDENVAPTIRVQMRLSGPYRPEIAVMIQFANIWFSCMDSLEDQLLAIFQFFPHLYHVTMGPLLSPVVNHIDPKLIFIPLVPIVAMIVVTSPILVGILVATLPVVLPIVSILLLVGTIASMILLIMYCSTSKGRHHIGDMIFKPIMVWFLSYKAGQRLIYETGPRPTPVHLARTILPKHDHIWLRLTISIVIDFIGSLSYLIPVLGELTDIGWAPCQTILIMALYDTHDTKSMMNESMQQLQEQPRGNMIADSLKYISFIEEILPFTDIVPTATFGWFHQYGIPFIRNLLLPENQKEKS